jgi:predicted transcriptional regulator
MPDFMLDQLLEESGGEIRLKEWSRLFKVSQPMLAWRLGIPGYFYEEYE